MNTGTVKLNTERLTLRKFRLSDYFYLKTWYCLPRVNPFTLSEKDNTLASCFSFLLRRVFNYYFRRRKKYYYWALDIDKNMIGFVGLNDCGTDKYSMYYMLSPEHRNNGYMTEAVNAVCEYMKTQEYERLYATCDTNNVASYSVLQSSGFTHTKRRINAKRYPDGRVSDVEVFELIK